MNQKGDVGMTTTTALPREKTTGAKELVCKFLGSLPFCGMDKDRPRINLSPNGERLPIKTEPLKERLTATKRTIAPGVPLLAEGSGGNIQHYIIVEGERFDIDQCCHLEDITKVNEKWEKTIAASKGIIVYNDQCKAIVSYARDFYLKNKKMPAMQRICRENGRIIEGENNGKKIDLPRNEVYKFFTQQPTRVIAAIAGLPSDYKIEDLEKAQGFPLW